MHVSLVVDRNGVGEGGKVIEKGRGQRISITVEGTQRMLLYPGDIISKQTENPYVRREEYRRMCGKEI
jgi:hypothetical protein